MIAYPDIDPVLIQIGPLAIRWYGLAYIIGILGGYWLVKKDLGEKLGLNADQQSNFLTALILGILLGGRIGYVLFYDLGFYLRQPLEILKVWHGGMSFHGGLLGSGVALWLFAKRNNISILGLLDLVAWVSTIGIGLGRLANFINAELLGRPTSVPWAMVFPGSDGQARHPSQLYEFALEGVVLFLLLTAARKWLALKEGQLLGLFLIGYGVARFFIEFFREPDAQIGLIMNMLSMGQLLCLGMLIAGSYILIKSRRVP